MKVVILTLKARMNDVTGDCLQARKTAEALSRTEGCSAVQLFFDYDGTIWQANGERAGFWQEVLDNYDIVHTIPPIPYQHIRRLPRLKAKLVASTIFWRSLKCNWISFRNGGFCGIKQFVKYVAQDVLACLGIRSCRSYKGYDLLLPNSEEEIRCVKKYCQVKPRVLFRAIPNAIDSFPEWIDSVKSPEFLAGREYLLVPGIFANRKNQSAMIAALREFEHPVVFIGGGKDYLEFCKRIGTDNMHFLGHVGHGSKEFYSCLKYARVVALSSNCETPGIALLEGAALGARPVAPLDGGTTQYYGWSGEYLDPLDLNSIRSAVERAWKRGRLSESERIKFVSSTWRDVALMTYQAYIDVLA